MNILLKNNAAKRNITNGTVEIASITNIPLRKLIQGYRLKNMALRSF
jgi:hypothetical protein